MKSTIYEFNPVLYPFTLLISKDFDIQELKDRYYIVLSKTDVTEITTELNRTPYTVAKTVLVVDKKMDKLYPLILLYRPKLVTTGIIAHEAFHANTFICHFLGINAPEPNADEPQAYFVEWTADCTESVLKGRPEIQNGKKIE